MFSRARQAGVLSCEKDGVREVVIETGDIMVFAVSPSGTAVLAVIAGREVDAAVLGSEISRISSGMCSRSLPRSPGCGAR